MNVIFLLVQRCLKKFERSRLRGSIRGYRKLKKSGRIDLISRVKEDLTKHNFSFTDKDFSSFFMGDGYLNSEIVIRQYLLIRIGDYNLNQALLLAKGKSGGKVIYPLPKEWRKAITNHGFDVANFSSSILWQLYIFSAFLYGMFQISKIFFFGLMSLIHKPIKPKKYVYFANLSSGNLPPIDPSQKSYDIVSWYLQWKGKVKNIGAIHHSDPNVPTKIIGDVDLAFQQDTLPSLTGLKVIFSYAFWGIAASLIALFDFFRGKWWHAFILNQAALSKQVRCLKPEFLAAEYLFHNSGWIYRPLWTYDAERAGSIISFYFYSTNCESFKNYDGYQPIPYGWNAMNWSRYLVWDDYQADFVKRSIGDAVNIIIVGPIWFSGRSAKIQQNQDLNIAIFDVTPQRHSQYSKLGLSTEFYTSFIASKFLKDIFDLSLKYDLKLLLKQKREIGKLAHPGYRSFLNYLISKKNIILIDPEVSSQSVIESSLAVISMPFTSVAILAKNMDKPSVYFDPSQTVLKDDRAAHGIQVISQIDELENWLKKIIAVDGE